MSSQDPETVLLQEIGTDILRAFVSVVVETWLVAIYTVLVFKASRILLDKERRRGTMARATLAVVLVMYLIDFSLWIMDVRNVISELNLTLISNSTDTLDVRYAAAGNSILRISLVEDVLYSYMTILGDAIVIWRCYAFWSTGNERFVLILPGIVYLVSVVLCCLLTFCAAQSGANLSLGAFTHPAFCLNIQTTSYWVQLATPAVATALIGLKTWRYRKTVASFNGNPGQRSPVNRAMIILVDTGILYVLFFLAEAVLGFGVLHEAIAARPTFAFAYEVYEFMTSSVVGIYPTVVVILVHTQFSLLDAHGNATITSMRFDASGRSRGVKQQHSANILSTGYTGRTGGRWTATDTLEDSEEAVRTTRTMTFAPEIGLRELHSVGSSGVLDVKDDAKAEL